MDPRVKESMLAYYDERAAEYDQVYAGNVQSGASADGAAYAADSRALLGIAAEVCRGRVLDAPCGTAFWLSGYAAAAEEVTLVDQSARMLEQARARAGALGIEGRCTFLTRDLLDGHALAENVDVLLCGYFLSHLDDPQERTFLAAASRSLRPGGTMLVFDSRWTPARARTRPKVGPLRRRLDDGREFEIFKRYLDRDDLPRLERRERATCELLHEGEVALAFSIRFRS